MKSLLALGLVLSPLAAYAAPPLPDPLLGPEGKVITTAAEWESTVRPRTLELFRENVYGRAPVGKPVDFESRVVREDPRALDGKATLKEIEITYSGPNGKGSIRPFIVIPNDAKKPVPAFLLINNRSPRLFDLASPNGFWPAAEIIARGYAAVGFHYAQVEPDKKDGYKDGTRAIFDKQPPADDAWGAVAAWSWGASRVLDHLVTDPAIDAGHVAVIGHSRGGKAALWAGAEDPRFALVISNDSGCTGAAPARIKRGETIAKINELFPHWFSANYKRFGGREAELPVDQHQLVALSAPRLVYVASASEDDWADPSAEYAACVNAAPVYNLLGSPVTLPDAMPATGTPLHQGRIGYHLRKGEHNLTSEDWGHFMDFADKHWKR